MRTSLRTLAWAAFLSTGSSMACSCFGPQSFCGTLDPPYPDLDPAWWIPDAIVLGVKVASVAHGMDVKLVTVFAGEAHVGDTVRVWGDTGLLCRMYADSWNVGDTVIWGLRWTDMAGGPLEQEGDYLISVCGTYWLEYQNGIVTGPLYEEGVNESIPVSDLGSLVHGCLVTGVPERNDVEDLVVRQAQGGPWLSLRTAARCELTVVDVAGGIQLSRSWDGSPLQLAGLGSGTYVVRVREGDRSTARRILVI